MDKKGVMLMKIKFWTIFLITFAIETGITYFLSSQFSVRFIEVMFFTGIVFLITSIYFSGGLSYIKEQQDAKTHAETGFTPFVEPPTIFRRGPFFIASLTFFLIGLIFFILLLTEIIPPVSL